MHKADHYLIRPLPSRPGSVWHAGLFLLGSIRSDRQTGKPGNEQFATDPIITVVCLHRRDPTPRASKTCL